MKKYYRVNEVASLLGVSPSSVRLYVRDGKIECNFTPSGQRIFTQGQVDKFLGVGERTPSMIHYVRSSTGDKTLLRNQATQLETVHGEPTRLIKDSGSGLNENRKGLQKLLTLVEAGGITHVAVTQKDRLTRFGYTYLERYLKTFGTEILVLGDDKEKSLQEELMQDFMNLIASFSGKFYRLRGYEQQRLLLKKAEDTINEKQ